MSAIKKGQLVMHEHDAVSPNRIRGIVLEPGEHVTKILWFDDEEQSGWIVSDWHNGDFEVLDDNILPDSNAPDPQFQNEGEQFMDDMIMTFRGEQNEIS